MCMCVSLCVFVCVCMHLCACVSVCARAYARIQQYIIKCSLTQLAVNPMIIDNLTSFYDV